MVPRGSTDGTAASKGLGAARYGVVTLRAAGALARGTRASLGASTRTIRASLPAARTAAQPPLPAPTAAAEPHFDGRRFRNIETDSPITARVALTLLKGFAARGSVGSPPRPVLVERPDIPSAAADLAATWLGHATALLEIDGCRILADPMFGDRASPSTTLGPRRLHPVPIGVAELPPLDAVLISHDHYDHLDRPTIAAVLASGRAPFFVPLGIGAHLRGWGVPTDRIVELDWHQSRRLGPLTIICTPARHFSGRGLTRNTTLWSSWAVAGPNRRVYFGGDTGYTAAFAEIGRRYGPFDLTVLPIGAYDAAWPDIHMTPEQALTAHADLSGAVLLPIHWATFNLALHPWAEPVQRLLRAARDEVIATPPPGRRVVASDAASHAATRDEWWDAAERPGGRGDEPPMT